MIWGIFSFYMLTNILRILHWLDIGVYYVNIFGLSLHIYVENTKENNGENHPGTTLYFESDVHLA